VRLALVRFAPVRFAKMRFACTDSFNTTPTPGTVRLMDDALGRLAEAGEIYAAEMAGAEPPAPAPGTVSMPDFADSEVCRCGSASRSYARTAAAERGVAVSDVDPAAGCLCWPGSLKQSTLPHAATPQRRPERALVTFAPVLAADILVADRTDGLTTVPF